MPATVPYRQCLAWIILLLPALTGCTAWRSVPARCFPSGVYYGPRGSQEPINFIHLRQDPPEVYVLGPRDVLGIYIEGVLGGREEPPPVHFPEQGDLPPAIGYPIPVRDDGTLSLPLVSSIHVSGLTLPQAEEEIRKAYTVTQRILQPGRDRIVVTLMRPRTYQVLVIREDVTTPSFKRGSSAGELILGSGKRGMTYAVDLPAYENDVLHALSESGGLPGVDAKNEITILRGAFSDADTPKLLPAIPSHPSDGPEAYLAALVQQIEDSPFDSHVPEADQEGDQQPPGTVEDEYPSLLTPELFTPHALDGMSFADEAVIKIPLRVSPGEPPPELTQDDIILHTGDIVFIESREAEVFYTGGLLKGGQFPIPRDYDLDILGAIAMAGGSVAAAAGGSGTQGSLGGGYNRAVGSLFPPTRAIVVRTAHGQQISIKVDLRRALLDPSERILIEPNDFILLEYKPLELILNILLNNIQVNYFLNQLNR